MTRVPYTKDSSLKRLREEVLGDGDGDKKLASDNKKSGATKNAKSENADPSEGKNATPRQSA